MWLLKSRARAPLMAALVAVFLATATATQSAVQAQDDTYVNLSIEVVADEYWTITARNIGTADAYGVTVDIEVADQTIVGSDAGFEQRSGTDCSDNIPGTTCIRGTWAVGSLGAGEEVSLAITARLASGLPCCANASDYWSVPARAVIKNTVPEEERFKGDNTAVGWILVNRDGSNTQVARANYWLEASVDDLLPDAGDTVKFTFKAVTTGGVQGSVGDAKVRLKLDDGMGDPTATPSTETFGAVSDLTRTWDWDFDLTHPTASKTLEVSTTLDNPLPDGVDRSDLCLTAEMTAERPADRVPGDNSAKICLREDSVTVLQTGKSHLFTLYPCVGVSTYPCSSSDTVEMAVNGGEAARAAGIGRDEAIMKPGNVVVQVKDHDGREVSGGTLSWWVSTDAELSTSIDNSRLSSAEWTHFQWKIASTQLPTGGNLQIGPNASRSGVFLHTSTKTQHPQSISAMAAGLKIAFPAYIKFESLGTYIIDFTQVTRHDNGTASDTTDDVDYSATGRYTFHVGPVAELEARDGDAGLAPSGTRAFTIVAVNNGPDDAPDVQVTVTGLNAGDYVSHSATAGTFDSATGVWTVGELKNKDFRRNVYGRDGEVLTIITSAAVDAEITAAISNTQDYEVCIDSSAEDVVLSSPSETACTDEDATNTWHTAKYYDYIGDNDRATIRAKDGTGADLPSLRGARERTAAIVVSWDAVAEVNGRKVAHYEVQRQTSPWATVANNVVGTRYVDTDVQAGDTHRYRVRAINDWGQKGPWSGAIEGSVPAIPTPEPRRPEPTPRPTPEPRRSDPEPSNSSPRFTEGGSTTRHVQENSEPGTDVGSPVAAEDRNRDSLTYALEGADAASFEIVESSGQIRTKAELDYETKARYRVTVTVSDGKNSRGEANEGVDDVIDVAIAVTNQGEQGSITLSEALPVVGTAIEAKLTDPDGGVSGVTWVWERSSDGAAQDAVWAEIPGATSAAYTPVDGDSGHYLRVTASYTDGHGPSKSATVTLGSPVAALGLLQRYDSNGDGAISLGEALQAAGDYRDGIIAYDEAIAVANLYFESYEP